MKLATLCAVFMFTARHLDGDSRTFRFTGKANRSNIPFSTLPVIFKIFFPDFVFFFSSPGVLMDFMYPHGSPH